MKNANYEFWFVAGSQHLYGEEQLKNVARDAEDIVKKLNASGKLPYPIVFKGVMTTADGITKFMKEVNYQEGVAGVMAWMHTFSPAKNWIRGEVLLQKPLLHLATQYLDRIPYDTIDFDYMNLNQSAHGDREYGYINARLGLKNKIVYGHFMDEEVQQDIADWEDVAVAYNESFHIKVCRFGDTMRNVAVTEGDKVQAQIQLGWTVDYWPVGDLVEVVDAVAESDIDAEYAKLQKDYKLTPQDNDAKKFEHNVRYQLREYLGIKKFLDDRGYTAFCTNFEDLKGLEQRLRRRGRLENGRAHAPLENPRTQRPYGLHGRLHARPAQRPRSHPRLAHARSRSDHRERPAARRSPSARHRRQG